MYFLKSFNCVFELVPQYGTFFQGPLFTLLSDFDYYTFHKPFLASHSTNRFIDCSFVVLDPFSWWTSASSKNLYLKMMPYYFVKVQIYVIFDLAVPVLQLTLQKYLYKCTYLYTQDVHCIVLIGKNQNQSK